MIVGKIGHASIICSMQEYELFNRPSFYLPIWRSIGSDSIVFIIHLVSTESDPIDHESEMQQNFN